jgi:hypothetical protein
VVGDCFLLTTILGTIGVEEKSLGLPISSSIANMREDWCDYLPLEGVYCRKIYLPTYSPVLPPFKCSAGAAGSSLVYYGPCITDVSQRVLLLPSYKHIQVLFLLRNGFGPIARVVFSCCRTSHLPRGLWSGATSQGYGRRGRRWWLW